jgi:tetraacyldisaccharide 4'-kinase
VREPAFWYRPPSWISRLLTPLGTIYGLIASARMQRRGVDVGIPVLCVGNYHAGGAGKTPTVLMLTRLLRDLGETPVVLSRGYGGRSQGPIKVDGSRDTAADVGDEALMLALTVPVVVARDRVGGAALARS